MSPIDKNSLSRKLAKLEELTKLLENYRDCSEKKFIEDFTLNGAVMHYLAQGIEVITDIGHHLLAETFNIHPESYRDIIIKLGETKIVPPKFAEENADMASFRNIITHAYAIINLKLVYKNLQKAPKIFRKFTNYYLKFPKKSVKKSP